MKEPLRKRRRVGRTSTEVTLLVVDNVPLRDAAWERLGMARKRLTKATADLHRHEQEDEPAYRAWMFATCPTLLSEIRELMTQIQTKANLVSNVEALAWREGKPPAVIWQKYKGEVPSPEELYDDEDDDFDDEIDEEDFSSEDGKKREAERIVEELLREQGIDPLSPEAEMMRDFGRALSGRDVPSPDETAKEIYRRLVQQLHPDRGGEWSAKREALWHEVQRAWDARDADWLSRLEAELEIATETLSAQSALGRLYAAAKEIEAARRDTERKLRHYRKTPAWRFTLRERDPEEVRDLTISLREERNQLRQHLARLEETLARWSKPLGLARAKQRGAAEHAERSAKLSQLNLW